MKTQITLDYSQAQRFENEAIAIALQIFDNLSEDKLNHFFEILINTYDDERNNAIAHYQHNYSLGFKTPGADIKKKILACVPQIADEGTRFELLKLEILQQIATWGSFFWNRAGLSYTEIYPTFKYLLDKIEQLKDFQSQWYEPASYSKTEVQNIVGCLTYILEKICSESYQKVYEDSAFIIARTRQLPYIPKPKPKFNSKDEYPQDIGEVELIARYNFNILDLNFQFNLRFDENWDASYPPFQINWSPYPSPEFFKSQIAHFLAVELEPINRQNEMSLIHKNQFRQDWQLFENQYNTVSKSPDSIDIKADFITQNGKLLVSAKRESFFARFVNRGYLWAIIGLIVWLLLNFFFQ
ncbi:MAG: hypothetical protein MUE85_20635 [Microscillaceae bacterium]|jgi:hypothetical protein|nr:hypothetical protein [Microscillaceae bacterium]